MQILFSNRIIGAQIIEIGFYGGIEISVIFHHQYVAGTSYDLRILI